MIQKINQILIIADDLSGAADCTAGAVRAGLNAQVTLRHALASSAIDHASQVWSIDADTRRLSPAEAAKIQAEILQRCRRPRQLLYKKIDSTLRGNFAAELVPVVASCGMAVVAPAFPDAGRSTRNGRQYVNGVALEETEVWRHEGILGVADIPEMLSAHGLRSVLIELAQVRVGGEALRKAIQNCMEQGVQVVVCDAETNEDLQRVAQALIAFSSAVVWVGSAGLANYLPDAAGLATSTAPVQELKVTGAILTVVGSLSAVSREQAAVLSRERVMVRMDIPADMLIEGEGHHDWKPHQVRLGATLEGGGDILLVICDNGRPDLRQGLVLCQALARLISPYSSYIGGMVSTGGETTNALLSIMESVGLDMVGEVQPGIPLSVTLGPVTFPIITKAGAFGSAKSLVSCYDALERMRRLSAHGANQIKNNACALQNHSV